MERIKRIFDRYREPILYIITGGMTTLVNFSVYFLLKNLFGLHYVVSQVFSVAAAIVFAYITNKFIVFRDETGDFRRLALQFISFVALRLVSGAIETLLMVLFVEKFAFNEDIVKVVVAFLIVALNYIFGKVFVFRKRA